MKLTLHVWRQDGPDATGRMETFRNREVDPNASFLEVLDLLNEELILASRRPIAFDHDCREGICGTCSLVVDGIAHGPGPGAVCLLHARHFEDGTDVYVEPFRAAAFPVIRDLMVDRSALERIQQAGGFVSTDTGGAPDGNVTLIPKREADAAFDAAACIGCGACVAACKNASAMLFTATKVSHLAHLPQGRVERRERARRMVAAMDAEGFGNCTNYFECEAVCPAGIGVQEITTLNREYLLSSSTVD